MFRDSVVGAGVNANGGVLTQGREWWGERF